MIYRFSGFDKKQKTIINPINKMIMNAFNIM